MTDLVGWYAHHVGAGHVARARLVSEQMRTPVVILSSSPRPADWPADRWVALPSDAAPGGHDHGAGGVLHWAPLGHAGYGGRMRQVAAWLDAARPALVVSDVSVEVTLLCRLLGVPVATVVMAGDRTDRPHQLAYDAATWLFSAWPEGVQPTEGWQARWEAKTRYLGGFSRFDLRRPSPPPGTREVTVLWGRGGAGVSEAQVQAAAEATPAWSWTVCRHDDPERVWATLQAGDVVVCHAGQNVVAEVAAARRAAVVIPEARPHDEQRQLAAALQQRGLAQGLTAWPSPGRWPDVLRNAQPHDPADWARWSDGRGATRFAQALDRAVATPDGAA